MKTKSEKQEYWQNHNRAYEESGLSLAAYCTKAEISDNTLRYFREMFQRENRDRVASQKRGTAARFVEVRPSAPPAKEFGVEIQNQVVARVQLGRGAVLECLRWPEAEWLMKLIVVQSD